MKLNYTKNDLGKSFGLAVAVMLVGQFLLSFFFLGFVDETGQLQSWAFWTMQAAYSLIIGSVALLYANLTKTSFISATTANQKPKMAHVGWGCLATLFLIALMLPVNNWLLDLIEKCGFARPSVDMPMDWLPMLAVACVLPAVTEEFVFRGTVAQSVGGNKSKLSALAISGGLFALFHMNPAQTLHQFVLGAFLTLLALRSGSVWTSVLVHLFNNGVAVALVFLLPDENIVYNNGIAFAVVGVLSFAASCFGYVKTTKSHWREGENTQSMQPNSVLFLALAVAVCAIMWILNLVLKQ